MYLNLTVAIVTSYYIFRCPKVSILIENIYISNQKIRHLIMGLCTRYSTLAAPAPWPMAVILQFSKDESRFVFVFVLAHGGDPAVFKRWIKIAKDSQILHKICIAQDPSKTLRLCIFDVFHTSLHFQCLTSLWQKQGLLNNAMDEKLLHFFFILTFPNF